MTAYTPLPHCQSLHFSGKRKPKRRTERKGGCLSPQLSIRSPPPDLDPISPYDNGGLPAVYENDKRDPKNWSVWHKTFVIGQLALMTLSLTFASSVSSAAEEGMIQDFGCSTIAATASTGLFLVGIGLGAIPMAPLSELYGRLPVYLITMLLATLFEIASALAPNVPGLLILRLIAGFWSSSPLSNSGGTLNDIGDPVLGLSLYLCSLLLDSPVQPSVQSSVDSSPFLMSFFFMPETLALALIKYKAVQYRLTTGEDIWRAPM
ncbi:hypothetical protein I204_08549 [Kwoniella mangroviensis CBS 8886]|nr:hypothetical protein I204_08549 [Kwoniella mangroviensis CBS 8886]